MINSFHTILVAIATHNLRVYAHKHTHTHTHTLIRPPLCKDLKACLKVKPLSKLPCISLYFIYNTLA